MAGYSGLDFGSVHDQLGYWLGHTSSYFKGGFSGSGENGNDFAMPTGTPVYAVASGTVVGSGYYGGGGVVSIQQHPGTVWYYQHLDENVAQAGQFVNAGELIGYSGGQNSGGNHPSSPTFSGYQHIEVGIDAPWGGIWGGGANVGPNVDPRPVLEGMYTATATGNTIPTGGNAVRADILPPLFAASNTGPGGTTGLSATQDAAGQQQQAQNCQPPTAPVWDVANYTAQWAAYLQCQAANGIGGEIGQGVQAAINATGIGPIANFFATVAGNWQADLVRVLKLVFGTLVIIASLLIFILPDAAATLVAAAGAPEAAGAIRQGVAHPTTIRPHRIIANTYRTRSEQKQAAVRGYRYAREAQQEDVRRQETQKAKAQRGAATRPLGNQQQQAPARASVTKPLPEEQQQPVARPWRPGLGLSRKQNVFSASNPPPGGFPASRAAPITQPLSTAIPERGAKTGLTFPENILFWRRQGKRGIPTLVRQGRQQPGPINPPPIATQEELAEALKLQKQKEVDLETQRHSREIRNADVSETYRALGLSTPEKVQKVKGTEVTLETERATLQSLEGIRANTNDPAVLRGIDRDILAVQARIARLEGRM